MAKRKIIYICGLPHCGSTILDLVLSSCPEIASLGQMYEVHLKTPDQGDLPRLKFWHEVLDQVDERQLATLGDITERSKKERYLPRLISSKQARFDFAACLDQVFAAVFGTLDAPAVVDSSKGICRALGVAESQLFDVYIIHLIRDVRGFINSKNKRFREYSRRQRFYRPAMHWFLRNLTISTVLRRRVPRYLALKYEELQQQPDVAIDQLERYLDLPLDNARKCLHGSLIIDADESLGIGGNRILHSREQFYFSGTDSNRGGAYDSMVAGFFLKSVGWLWGY